MITYILLGVFVVLFVVNFCYLIVKLGSGSNIGRQVHILVDSHTGKAVCQEDEKTQGNMCLLFGIIGLAVLVLLLAQSFGVLV